jgi:hypothetical protein
MTSLFPPRESLVVTSEVDVNDTSTTDIPAGDGKLANLFLRCKPIGLSYLDLCPPNLMGA